MLSLSLATLQRRSDFEDALEDDTRETEGQEHHPAGAAGRGRLLPYIQRKTSARRLLPDVSVCGRLPPAWPTSTGVDCCCYYPICPPTHFAISTLPRKAFLGKDFWRIDVQSWSDIEMDFSDIECCCQSGVQPTPSVEKSARERDICTTPL